MWIWWGFWGLDFRGGWFWGSGFGVLVFLGFRGWVVWVPGLVNYDSLRAGSLGGVGSLGFGFVWVFGWRIWGVYDLGYGCLSL